MRILFLNPIGQIGGAETSLVNIVSVLRASRPDWCVGTILGSAGPLAQRLESLGASVDVFPMPPAMAELGDHGLGETMTVSRLGAGVLRAAPRTSSYCAGLRRRVRQFRPDLVHSNGLKMHVLAIPAALGVCPVVWHLHEFVGSRRLMSRLLSLFANRIAGCIANSQSVADDAVQVLRLRRPPAKIYNAIRLDTFTPSGPVSDLDQLSGLPPAPLGTMRVGLLGTFARWKGHGIFLQALARLRASVPVRGYIIGGPVYQTKGSQYSQAELESMALDCGVGDRVGFTGYVENPAASMRALDIVVHASTRPEPFGLSVVEAMACGRPVVAANAGGVAEIIRTGGALGVQSGNPDDLALCLRQLIETPQYKQDLVRRAREAAEKLCSPLRLQSEITAYYESICA